MIREAIFILGLATGILGFMVSRPATEMGGDVKDGFQLLAMAQKKQIDEIGFALVFQLEQLAAEETE